MALTKNDNLVFSDKLLRKIFDSLSAHIAIIDEKGFILETNIAWKKFSSSNGLPEDFDFKQINYLNICESTKGEEAKDAKAVIKGIKDVMDKKTDEFLYDYPCHSPDGMRWFYMRAILMDDKGPAKVIISHENITELKIAQKTLEENQNILNDRNQSLEEANIALKVLIRQREQDKADMEKKFLTNIKTFVIPYLAKLKEAKLTQKDRTLLKIIDDHLNDIISPLMQKLSNANVMLTPQEIQVAALVKDGQTTSDIADILFISEATVNFHRKNLRAKLGLKNSQKNLRSFLMSMS